jgi:hypothetical protein
LSFSFSSIVVIFFSMVSLRGGYEMSFWRIGFAVVSVGCVFAAGTFMASRLRRDFPDRVESRHQAVAPSSLSWSVDEAAHRAPIPAPSPEFSSVPEVSAPSPELSSAPEVPVPSLEAERQPPQEAAVSVVSIPPSVSSVEVDPVSPSAELPVPEARPLVLVHLASVRDAGDGDAEMLRLAGSNGVLRRLLLDGGASALMIETRLGAEAGRRSGRWIRLAIASDSSSANDVCVEARHSGRWCMGLSSENPSKTFGFVSPGRR